MAVWLRARWAEPGLAEPVLFLDRDGVVIRDRDYLADPARVEVLPGVAAAMVRARAAGFRLIGVSNQSGIGRGYFTVADLDAVMQRVVGDLQAAGASFDGFYYCPHAPGDNCACRKPRLGLLDEVAGSCNWDPGRSWVIGDKASDVAWGLDAGIGAALVRSGYGGGQEAAVKSRWGGTPRLMVADDLAAAVTAILALPKSTDRTCGS